METKILEAMTRAFIHGSYIRDSKSLRRFKVAYMSAAREAAKNDTTNFVTFMERLKANQI